MSSRTLRGRLALVATLVTAVWVIAMTVAVDVFLVHQLDNQAGDVLRARAEAASAEVRVSRDGRLSLTEPGGDDVLDAQIWVYEGALALEVPARVGRLTPAVETMLGRGSVLLDVKGSRLLARPVRAVDGRQVGTIVAAVNLRPYSSGARVAVGGSIALGVLLLGSVYPVTRFAVGRALRPVADLSDQAAKWSADDVSQRFGSRRRPQELEDLARDLDGLLDRLSAVLRHERQLSAEISHELRTPLSRMTAEVELLQREAQSTDTDAGLSAVMASATQMEQILATLLATARSESTAPPGRCALEATVRRAADVVALPDGVLMTVDGDSSLVAGVEPPVLERIIAPVLQNAARYATHRITVRCAGCDESVEVSIVDDGPGLGALGAEAFEPGVTGTADHDGAGLGLALARRLARAAGGDLVLDATDGGAAFRVILPKA
ncbi:MAG: ATP-binding protein [Mycobacteriales bacterium]